MNIPTTVNAYNNSKRWIIGFINTLHVMYKVYNSMQNNAERHLDLMIALLRYLPVK